MYRIESINARTRTDGDESDLPWQEVPLPANVNASDLGAILRHMEDLEFCDEGLRYRYLEVEEEPCFVDHWIPAEQRWVKVEGALPTRRVA